MFFVIFVCHKDFYNVDSSIKLHYHNLIRHEDFLFGSFNETFLNWICWKCYFYVHPSVRSFRLSRKLFSMIRKSSYFVLDSPLRLFLFGSTIETFSVNIFLFLFVVLSVVSFPTNYFYFYSIERSWHLKYQLFCSNCNTETVHHILNLQKHVQSYPTYLLFIEKIIQHFSNKESESRIHTRLYKTMQKS